MKSVQYRAFSGPYIPVLGVNTEIYPVNLRIQSEYRKILTTKNSVFEYFSRSATIDGSECENIFGNWVCPSHWESICSAIEDGSFNYSTCKITGS